MNLKELKGRDSDVLHESFLFRGVSGEAVSSICSGDGCRLLKFEKGEVIYSPESFLKCCGLILAGSVKVTKASPSGQELLMNILKRGSMFGAAALWTEHEGYVTSLTALEKCRVIFFSQELLESAMKKEPDIALNYIRFLTDRVCFLNDKIQNLIAGRSANTLAQYLEALSEQSGSEFALETGLTELASILNISRASLYRAFEALETENAVKRDGRNIVILNRDILRRFSE
jgi:cAMP-binding proteins - catabolite gene activator and regulatory subunit of cAMP-dependent protein kinases